MQMGNMVYFAQFSDKPRSTVVGLYSVVHSQKAVTAYLSSER